MTYNQIVIFEYKNVEIQLRQLLVTIQSNSLAKRILRSSRISKLGYVYFSQNRKNSQNEKSMRVPVLVYLILSQNFLHESLQKLILRFVAGLRVVRVGKALGLRL